MAFVFHSFLFQFLIEVISSIFSIILLLLSAFNYRMESNKFFIQLTCHRWLGKDLVSVDGAFRIVSEDFSLSLLNPSSVKYKVDILGLSKFSFILLQRIQFFNSNQKCAQKRSLFTKWKNICRVNFPKFLFIAQKNSTFSADLKI